MTALETFDVGSPEKFGGCHIGLYQPMINRFLLTLCDIQHARDIALIASNRYPLFLVNLVTANNYSENLIDNECCENWTIPSTQILQTTLKNYANVIVDAEHLTDLGNNLAVDNEKQYLQLCWYYLRLFDFVFNKNVKSWRIKQFMSDVFALQEPMATGIQNLKKQVIAELFLSKDINSTRTSIENIIDKAKKDYDIVF